jgi:hypothetical protein
MTTLYLVITHIVGTSYEVDNVTTDMAEAYRQAQEYNGFVCTLQANTIHDVERSK